MRYIYFFVPFALSFAANAQTVIQPETNVSLANGTLVKNTEDIVISNNATLDNNGKILFEKNLSNYGSPQLNGEFIASGTQDQTITGTDSFSLETLTVNSRYNTYVASRLGISKNLDLQRGIIHSTAAGPLVFSSGANNPKESITSYINGTAIMSQRNINTDIISYLGCTVKKDGSSGLGNFEITRTTGDEGIIGIGDNSSIAAKWTIKASPDVTNDYDLTLTWLSPFDNSAMLQDLLLFGTSSIDSSRFVLLDQRTSHPTQINPATEQRSYRRIGLDRVGNRTFTLTNGNSLVNSIPDVHITSYPNPATDHINLAFENFEPWAQCVDIKVTDAYGKVYAEKIANLDGNVVTINDLGSLPTGVYRLFISRGQLTKVVNFFKK